MTDMLSRSFYQFNPYAVPTLVTASLLLWLALAVWIRERGSYISRIFALTVLPAIIWLWSFSLMYCATDYRTALFWTKIAYLGVPFIPAGIFHFTAAVLRLTQRYRVLIRFNWLLSAFFVAAILCTDALIEGLQHYWWGYYPRYGWLSAPYLTYFFGMMLFTLRCYRLELKRSAAGTAHNERTRAFLIAFSIVYLGSVDYLAKFGIAVYPFGYIAILCFLALSARAIARYNLVDITPALTAEPILESMQEAVLVLDMEGAIQLTNRATCRLFGRSGKELIHQPLTRFVDHPLFASDLHALARAEATRNYYELSYTDPLERSLTLGVSISVVRNPQNEPTAVVCFISDITVRKTEEERLSYISTIAEGWKELYRSRESADPISASSAASARRPLPEEPTTDPSSIQTPWFLRSRSHLFVTLLLTLACPLTLLMWAEANQGRRWLESQTTEHNQTAAALTAEAVQKHFEGLIRYVESFATRAELTEAVRRREQWAVVDILHELVTQNPYIDRAFIANPDGTLWVDSPAFPDSHGKNHSYQDWYSGVTRTQSTYLSQIYQRTAPPQVDVVAIATPIRTDHDKVLAYLVGHHTVQSLKAMLDHNHPPQASFVQLLDRSGRVAASVTDDNTPDGLSLSAHPAVQSIFKGKNRAGSLRLNFSGYNAAYLVSFSSVGKTGWFVFVGRDEKEVLSPIRTLQRTVIWASLGGFFLILGLGFLWLNTLRRFHQTLLAANKAKTRYVADLKLALDERTKTEEVLRQLAAIVESSNDAIVGTTPEGRIEIWNKAAERVFGYSAEEAKGRSASLLVPADRLEDITQILAETRSGGTTEDFETVYTRKDGKPVTLSLSVAPIRDSTGRLVGAAFTARDVTERKWNEEELRRTNLQLAERQRALMNALADLSQANEELRATQLQLIQVAKMESIGRLAAGVAHEVKNPLATLLMGIDVLSDHFRTHDETVIALLKDMNRAVHRADSVIKGLLDFSAPHELQRTIERLNTILEQTLLLLKHHLDRNHVQIVKNLSNAVPPLALDRIKIEQVFVNLLMNAIQAMPGGGMLTVTSAVLSRHAAKQFLNLEADDWQPSGNSVVAVEVCDTGAGIPEDKIEKVFDPFFTTKATGQGTGLGLTVSQKIIELHGGRITIGNRQAGGVRVSLVFNIEEGNTNGHQKKNPVG